VDGSVCFLKESSRPPQDHQEVLGTPGKASLGLFGLGFRPRVGENSFRYFRWRMALCSPAVSNASVQLRNMKCSVLVKQTICLSRRGTLGGDFDLAPKVRKELVGKRRAARVTVVVFA
jgi:hypothetical protein